MKWLSKLLGRPARRSLENPAVPLTLPFYGPPALAGIYVNEQSALTFSAFWAAVRNISVDVASLKIEPMIRSDQGGCEPARDHWSYPLVFHSPDGMRPAIRFWASLMQHALTWGNGFAEIVRGPNGWEGVKLRLLPPERVFPRLEGERLYYEVHDEFTRRVQPFNMIHIANPMSYDGVVGRSVVQTARESIGLGLAGELSMAAWYGNAARPGGRYKVQPGIGEQARINLREYVDAMHAGPLNNGRPAIDPPGADWSPDVLPAPDQSYLASRVFQVQEIARWFSIPPSKCGDYSEATFANLEQAEKSYWKSGVKPWADFIEAELNLKLFNPSEQGRLFCRANYHELTVTDVAVKTAYFASGRQWGYLSVNDIMHIEGRNGIGEAGDVYLSPGNMVTDKQIVEQQNAPPPPVPEPSQTPAPEQPKAASQAKALEAVRQVVSDGLGRVLRRQAAAVRRAATKPGFSEWSEEFFTSHRSTIEEQLGPAVRAFEAVSGSQVDLPGLADAWVEEDRTSLASVEEVCLPEQLPAAIEDLIRQWEGRLTAILAGLN